MKRLWIKADKTLEAPYIIVFRNEFTVKKESYLKFKFSADERCQLFLNGSFLAEGPERGCPETWHWQQCKKKLIPGDYCLVARVLCFGNKMTAHAQCSVKHGLYIDEESTLLANWQWQEEKEFTFETPWPDWGVFPRFKLKNANWKILQGQGGIWRNTELFTDERPLNAPFLPTQKRERELRYQQKGNRIIFDDYVCVWSEFLFKGKGTAKIRWSECFYENDEIDPHKLKGNKGKRDGDFIVSKGNELVIDADNCLWIDYFWQSGRIVELELSGVELLDIKFYSCGFPFEKKWHARSSDEELNKVLDLAYRTLECCSHDTFMDCPYYEQMMYIGDARLESLSLYLCTDDMRLTEKSLYLLAHSQGDNGLLFARYPAKVDQLIASFNFIYLMMLHDYALWQNNATIIKDLLPLTRKMIACFAEHLKESLLYLPGWNFIDWVSVWERGVPQGSEESTSSCLNYLAVLALQKTAELEKHFGEEKFYLINQNMADTIEKTIWQKFYNKERALLANDLEQKYYSEHSQILAMLSNSKIPTNLFNSLKNEKDLPQCSIYFSFYYLEACYLHQESELFFERLKQWKLLTKKGLKTLPEEFDNPRSDCHAWSSHVLYHYFASIMGIRPTKFGGEKVEIKPMKGNLKFAEGTSPAIRKYLTEMKQIS